MVGNTWCHLVPCARLSSRRGEVGPGWLWACTVDGIRLEFGGSSCSANLSLSPARCGQATGTRRMRTGSGCLDPPHHRCPSHLLSGVQSVLIVHVKTSYAAA